MRKRMLIMLAAMMLVVLGLGFVKFSQMRCPRKLEKR